MLDVTFPYREDVARVRRVLSEVADDLWHDEDFEGVIIEQPEIWGIEAVTADAITMRVTLKTAPLEQWRVAREMRARIKARFDAEGISAPYAHTGRGQPEPGRARAPLEQPEETDPRIPATSTCLARMAR